MEENDSKSRGCNIIGTETEYKCTSCGCNKLDVHNWLGDLSQSVNLTDLVEVRFKNTRKGFFSNVNAIKLEKGDVVAVEASPGHDVGIVSLIGDLVLEQLDKNNIPKKGEFKKIYRKAKPVDIEKWKEANGLEERTMIRARKIATELKLNMKIGDVEYQGDRTKAIFYYIADERVDFRQLIKFLADEFKVRIEMRQIGARQEAGRIGGIGPCGRELCCSTFVTNFNSVTTNAARFQELSLNPQKLAGQCSKLKCCLNYELDTYLDARKDIPSENTVLEVFDGNAYHRKTDIFKKMMWYSFDKDSSINMVAVPVERVKEIIKLNREGVKVEKLVEVAAVVEADLTAPDYQNVVGQESLTRFEEKKKKPQHKKKRRNPNNSRGNKPNVNASSGSESGTSSRNSSRKNNPKPNENSNKPNSANKKRRFTPKKKKDNE